MTDPTKFKALSRVYDLLGDFSERDLNAASEIAGLPSSLRIALRSLAETRSDLARGDTTSKINRGIYGKNRHVEGGKGVSPTSDTKGGTLRDVVMDKGTFHGAADVVKFLQLAGLPIRLRDKESRDRLYNRALTEIKKLPARDQQRVLSAIAEKSNQQETTGWFRVIRGSDK